MKVAVIGANGQLGSDVVRAFEQMAMQSRLTHADMEIAEREFGSAVFSAKLRSGRDRQHRGHASRGEVRAGSGQGLCSQRNRRKKFGAYGE